MHRFRCWPASCHTGGQSHRRCNGPADQYGRDERLAENLHVQHFGARSQSITDTKMTRYMPSICGNRVSAARMATLEIREKKLNHCWQYDRVATDSAC